MYCNKAEVDFNLINQLVDKSKSEESATLYNISKENSAPMTFFMCKV